MLESKDTHPYKFQINLSTSKRLTFQVRHIPEQQNYFDKSISNSEATYVVIGLNWGWQPAVSLHDKKEVQSKIPDNVLKKYNLISTGYSYYLVENDKNQFQF